MDASSCKEAWEMWSLSEAMWACLILEYRRRGEDILKHNKQLIHFFLFHFSFLKANIIEELGAPGTMARETIYKIQKKKTGEKSYSSSLFLHKTTSQNLLALNIDNIYLLIIPLWVWWGKIVSAPPSLGIPRLGTGIIWGFKQDMPGWCWYWFPPMLPPRSFIILHFAFRSMFHLCLDSIFTCGSVTL